MVTNIGSSTVHRVAILAAPRTNLLDVTGAAQVFTTAGEQLALSSANRDPAYTIDILSENGGLTVSTSGIAIHTKSISEVGIRDYDTVLVAGGEGAENPDQQAGIVRWLKRGGKANVRFGSICTGAFLLAEAGMLNGLAATTHWGYCETLQRRYPLVKVERDAIFLSDGGVWTSAGITAGIDLALAMVQDDWGREVALRTAQWLVVFLKRPGGQSQFSTPLRTQKISGGPVARVALWIVENPTGDLRLPALAELAGATERTLCRAFAKEMGCSPSSFVEQVRMEMARRLLEETSEDVVAVARKSGFGNAERMRRTFVRQLGVSPSDYRERFRPVSRHRDAYGQ